MLISTLANKLAKQHGTRDPFRIASDLGYIITETPLTGIRGYYQYIDYLSCQPSCRSREAMGM